MRARFSLITEKPQVIPINYNHHLASLIYRRIEFVDPDLSLKLHKPNTIKFFTFSKLLTKKRRILGDQLKIEGGVSFEFSTPKKEIIIALINGLLENPNIKIANADFTLEEVRVLREDEIIENMIFSTLSPISVTTIENSNGNRRIIDLYPNQPKFYENLRKNLVKKHVLLYGYEPEDKELEIKVKKAKAKRIRIKNTYHRCIEMVFEAEGSRELLKIGYQAGFGERNSMGFGMVKII